MMTASDELVEKNFEKCVECKCAVGDDWKYVDYTSKEFTKCPQCGEMYEIQEVVAQF